MLSSIALLLEEFDKNDIVYCHWKSNEHLLPALEGDTDLDVLFLPEQRSVLEGVLSKCGLKRFRSTPLSQYNAIEDYIGFDKAEAKIWHLHLHYRLTLGEKHLKGYTLSSWNKKIMEHRQYTEEKCFVSCPEHELLLLYIRMSLKLRIYDKLSKIGNDDLVEINWLKERVDWDKFRTLANELVSEKITCYIEDIAKSGSIKKTPLFPLKRMLRDELSFFTYYNRVNSSLVSYWRTLYSNVEAVNRHFNLNSSCPRRRVSPAGGCVIAFLGSDGAGKTTTIDYVKNEFGKKLDIKTAYLGSGDGECSLIRRPMRFVARKVGGKGLGDSVEKEYEHSKEHKSVSLKSRLYSFAKLIWAVTLAKEKRTKIHRITKARNRGMLVLVDRYPQIDYPGYGDGPLLSKYLQSKNVFLKRIAKWEFQIYKAATINCPDLFVKLIVPPEIAIQRKPEMTKEQINKKIEAVLGIYRNENNVVIDTSVDKKVSFGAVMDAIWKVL